MDWTLEVVILPVSDLESAVEFYRDKVGFELDHRTTNDQMDVAQLTPRGSGCSIVVGTLPAQQEMAPGSMRGLQLVVADAAAARDELVGRGVECGEVTVFDDATTSSGSPTPTATPGRCSSSRCAATSPSSR